MMATIELDQISRHPTGTRDEWLKQRLDLLAAEKELTRKSDELARRRQALPWVRVEKAYEFDTDDGRASLADLFRGRSQLIVYHLMFGPDYKAPCPSCSSIADGFNGIWEHLANHDVMLWAVSRAPLEKIQAIKQKMGWTFPWASSFGSDFNEDYGAGLREDQQDEGYTYNFQDKPPIPKDSPPMTHAAMAGVDNRTFLRELPGMSAFAIQDGAVHHTYSAYSRGLDALWGMYPWLDRAPLGRNEAGGAWWRRRGEYGAG
jgi:predicted dithiol-disulfide oxidoreductase (DUF899 family)